MRHAATPATIWTESFDAATVSRVRHALGHCLAAAGLTGDNAEDFVLAVNELVVNAIRHGGGSGRIRLNRVDGSLVCEVSDRGARSRDASVRYPEPDMPGGRGLLLAHVLTGSLRLTGGSGGLTAAVSIPLNGASKISRR